MFPQRLLLLIVLLIPVGGFAVVPGFEAIPIPNNGVYLRWTDAAADETGYLLERRMGDQAWTEVATTPPDVEVYTDTGLEADALYSYRITVFTGVPTSSTAEARTFPERSDPVPQLNLDAVQQDGFSIGITGEGASYAVRESTDLENWSTLETPFFLVPGQEYEIQGLMNRFYQVEVEKPERPKSIGLSVPFETPAAGDGEVWDVTLFGASPVITTNDDAIGINVAISVAEPGDVVYIPEGTYTIRQTLDVPTGVTLRGAGMDKTLLVTEGISVAVRIQPLVHDVRIADFAIDFLGDTEELLYGVYIGSARSGQNSYRIDINSLRIEHFSKYGIALRDCHHVLVRNCQILNATNLGGGGHGYGIALNYPTNHNNWIVGNNIGPVIRHGVLIQYFAHNNLVEKNTAIENTEDAFDLHGEDEYANELRLNIALDGDRDGFGVGNTGSTHDRSGPDNWIHHNTVERCLSGIEVIQGSDVVYIDHNTFRDNDYGVRVHNGGGNHVYVRHNTISGNRRGVSLELTQWAHLLNNRIENSSLYGIELLFGVTDFIDAGNILSGNEADYGP